MVALLPAVVTCCMLVIQSALLASTLVYAQVQGSRVAMGEQPRAAGPWRPSSSTAADGRIEVVVPVPRIAPGVGPARITIDAGRQP